MKSELVSKTKSEPTISPWRPPTTTHDSTSCATEKWSFYWGCKRETPHRMQDIGGSLLLDLLILMRLMANITGKSAKSYNRLWHKISCNQSNYGPFVYLFKFNFQVSRCQRKSSPPFKYKYWYILPLLPTFSSRYVQRHSAKLVWTEVICSTSNPLQIVCQWTSVEIKWY